jgi:hypothetical protein
MYNITSGHQTKSQLYDIVVSRVILYPAYASRSSFHQIRSQIAISIEPSSASIFTKLVRAIPIDTCQQHKFVEDMFAAVAGTLVAASVGRAHLS